MTMQEITLKYPVCNIDGLSLLPEGSAINKKNLRNVANLNSKTPLKLTPLLSHKTVKDDITSILNNKDYADVYSKKGCKKMILEQMSQVHLPAGVYGSLDYFKKNDTYSYHHFLSVFSLTTMIASEILTDEEMQLRLLSAGPTHDIGKTCVPLYILQKATSLLRKEKQILDEHSSSGYLLMSHYFADPDHISAVVARDHH
ncbi:MAG: HD domain-containing protein, partial [Deltaproteobacteria bacterium]|nr:HD domain-containing protein [Deltaproteobacteria bacterium]